MRFVWAVSFDLSSTKVVYGALLAVQIILNFSIFLVDKNYYLYAIWVWLYTFCEGGIFVLMPNIIKRIYGSKTTAMYGFIASFSAASSVITLFMYKWFLVPGEVSSYNMFFLFNGALSLISLILLLTVFSEKRYVPLCFRKNSGIYMDRNNF